MTDDKQLQEDAEKLVDEFLVTEFHGVVSFTDSKKYPHRSQFNHLAEFCIREDRKRRMEAVSEETKSVEDRMKEITNEINLRIYPNDHLIGMIEGHIVGHGSKRYDEGREKGIWIYAWWKDGVQYVGTGNTTYKEAIEELRGGRGDG